MPRIDLRAKPILISGASSGIGRATAFECARAGMPVGIAARRADRLQALAEELRAIGVPVLARVLDVVDAPACAEFVAAAEKEFGPVYAVFANAGYGHEGPVHLMSDDDLRRVFEVNFWGSLNLVRPALERFIARRSGHVLFCSSALSKLGTPNYASYSASKAAQDHFATAMGAELAPLGVHVSSVHPVRTSTDFAQAAQVTGPSRVARTPSWMNQPPERVARAVVSCLRRPRPEVWTSPARLVLALSVAAPGLARRVLRRCVKEAPGNHLEPPPRDNSTTA